MKSLRLGESIRSMHTVDCKYGKVDILITNLGVMAENQDGVVFDLRHEDITSVDALNKRLVRIAWSKDGNDYDFMFTSSDAAKMVCIFEESGLALRKLGGGIDAQSRHAKRAEKNAEQELASHGIPPYVPAEHIWNDCWYDKKYNLYVTRNKFFKQMKHLQSRPHQIEYRIRSSDEGIVARPDKVDLRYGVPSVKLDIDGKKTWVFLPTMNEQLVTRHIGSAGLDKTA